MERSQASQSSVFDFIYLDERRISLYLSQMTPYGDLTGLVKSVKSSDEDKFAVKGNVGPKALRAEIRSEANEGQETAIEKRYDTRWKRPIEFLKELQDRDLISRNFDHTRIGDIFITAGKLSLIDMRYFEKVWEAVAATHNPANRSGNKNRGRNITSSLDRPNTNAVTETEANGLRLMGSLKQPIFVNFLSKGREFWAIGENESVVGDAAAVLLKHGITIPGTWHLLAILDALPADKAESDAWLTRVCGAAGNLMGTQVASIVDTFIQILGRPAGRYGVTPLAIFREVSA